MAWAMEACSEQTLKTKLERCSRIAHNALTIRDLNVYPVRKFKFNKDNRRTDNRENDLKKPNSACIFRDYELTRLISY